MKARKMLVRRRYKIKGHVFKVLEKQKDGNILVWNVKEKYKCLVPFDYEVGDKVVRIKLMNGMKKEDINNFIKYISNKYWINKKKTYILLLRSRVKYKIDCRSQKVLCIKPIIGLKYRSKYKNGYYTYELKEFVEWFMKTEPPKEPNHEV